MGDTAASEAAVGRYPNLAKIVETLARERGDGRTPIRARVRKLSTSNRGMSWQSDHIGIKYGHQSSPHLRLSRW